MAIQFTVLGSGSGGNCAFLETPRTKLLIDAGFSGRQIAARLAGIGRAMEEIDAIILTHEHTDHTAGLNVLCNRSQLPLYCNRLTAEAIQHDLPKFKNWKIFPTGNSFEVGDLTISSFSIPHDASDPVGYVVLHEGVKIGFLTDLGHCTKMVVERMRAVNVLLLETNHDLKMLQDHPRRPWALKQRIASRHGHLSNVAAARAACDITTEGLRHVYLAHLSQECNRPELAFKEVRNALDQLGAAHVTAHLTSQESPCPTLTL
jgi:phosphoribosyl 1,2-cyclic phosphodiesterase